MLIRNDLLFLICAFCWGIEELQFYQHICDLLKNWKKSKISYSAVSVSKGTGGIAIFAAKNWKTNMCSVSLTKGIVGIANL